MWGWGGVGVFWWLASLIILLLKVWFPFTEIKGFCFFGLFFLSVKHFGIFEERRILMSFYTIRLPRALCFVADVQVFIVQFYLPGYNSLLDFIPVWIPLQRLSSLFYVHVSHNYLGYTSFLPSVPSSYMYFLTVFFSHSAVTNLYSISFFGHQFLENMYLALCHEKHKLSCS